MFVLAGGSVNINLLIFLAEYQENLVNLQSLPLLSGNNLYETFCGRFHFKGRLVCFNFEDDIALFDFLPDFYKAVYDSALLHRFSKPRQFNFLSHLFNLSAQK